MDGVVAFQLMRSESMYMGVHEAFTHTTLRIAGLKTLTPKDPATDYVYPSTHNGRNDPIYPHKVSFYRMSLLVAELLEKFEVVDKELLIFTGRNDYQALNACVAKYSQRGDTLKAHAVVWAMTAKRLALPDDISRSVGRFLRESSGWWSDSLNHGVGKQLFL